MRFLRLAIPLLILVAAVIFAYGTFEDPGQRFILSSLVPQLSPPPEEPLTLLFAGDMMLTRGMGLSIWNKGGGDPRYPFLKIAPTLVGADVTIGNLEGPISSRGTNVGSIYSFRFPPERVDGLVFAGFDVVSLANNHIWDYGAEALEDSLDILRNSGIAPVGAGRNSTEANAPHVIEVKGVKIAFLAHTNLYPKTLAAGDQEPGTSNSDLEFIKSKIAELKSQVDLIVLLWHWGEEYEPRSHPREQTLARKLVDAGADLIVGTHPHVTQEIENYKGKFIAYSLGNFIFDQGFSDETMRGHMLHVVVRDKKIVSAVPFPVQLNDTFQPSLGWRRVRFLENLPFENLSPPVELVEGFTTYKGALGDPVGDVHRGIDFARRDGKKLLPFDVFSMHDGTAMRGESETWGNFLIARFVANPTLRYYTVYAHLANIPNRFPDLKNIQPGGWSGVPIKAGEFLGQAGTSGNTRGETQLHIELQEEDLETEQWLKLDPYGVYGRSDAYLQPGMSLGDLKHYWLTDNPQFAK